MLSSRLHVTLACAVLGVVLLLNTVAVGYQVRTIYSATQPTVRTYSYEGSDHPRTLLGLDLGDPVALTIMDSKHFQVAAPESTSEWNSIFPPGRGFIHLGPQKRRFGLSMFHQIHCLDIVRNSLLAGTTAGHTQHCFNYLRQTILCAADLTLEEGVPELGPDPTGELPVNGLGMTHTCRDWSKVYAHVTEQYYDWKEWRKTHNITSL